MIHPTNSNQPDPAAGWQVGVIAILLVAIVVGIPMAINSFGSEGPVEVETTIYHGMIDEGATVTVSHKVSNDPERSQTTVEINFPSLGGAQQRALQGKDLGNAGWWRDVRFYGYNLSDTYVGGVSIQFSGGAPRCVECERHVVTAPTGQRLREAQALLHRAMGEIFQPECRTLNVLARDNDEVRSVSFSSHCYPEVG